MHSPRDQSNNQHSRAGQGTYQSKRLLSLYQKQPKSTKNEERKYSPQKMNRLSKLDTETDIVDEIKSYNFKKNKSNKEGEPNHLDLLFQRNQSSM